METDDCVSIETDRKRVHNMTQDAALRCTQRTQRKIEIDPILAFTTQHDASATEGVHKLKRQRNVLRHIVNTVA